MLQPQLPSWPCVIGQVTSQSSFSQLLPAKQGQHPPPVSEIWEGKYHKGRVCPQWFPSLLISAWLPNALLSRIETIKPLKRWTSSQFDCFWLNLGIQGSLGFPPLLLLRHRRQSRDYDRQMLDHQKNHLGVDQQEVGKITADYTRSKLIMSLLRAQQIRTIFAMRTQRPSFKVIHQPNSGIRRGLHPICRPCRAKEL